MAHLHHRLLIAAAAVVLLALPVHATTYYARQDGDDGSCDGTTNAAAAAAPNCAFATIDKCISSLVGTASEDVCQVVGDNWTETKDVTGQCGVTGSPLIGDVQFHIPANTNCSAGCVVRGDTATPSNVTLSGAADAVFCSYSSTGWTVEGFESVNTALAWDVTDYTPEAAHGFTLRHMVVTYDTKAEIPVQFFKNIEGGVTLSNITIAPSYSICADELINPQTVPLSQIVENIDGFTLQDSRYSGAQLGELNSTTNAIIRRNEFIMGLAHGHQIIGRNSTVPTCILVENNVFRGDAACDTICSAGCDVATTRTVDAYDFEESACDDGDTYGVVVRNNTVYGRGYQYSDLFFVYCGGECPGTNECDREHLKIYNNVIHGVDESEDSFWFFCEAPASVNSGPVFADGNYYGTGPGAWGGIDSTGGGPDDCDTLTSDFAGVWQICDVEGGTNNIDPNSIHNASATDSLLFTDAGNNDFTPARSSPLVDAGVTGDDADGVRRCAADDFAGNARDDGTCDIGAFEDQDGAEAPERRFLIFSDSRDFNAPGGFVEIASWLPWPVAAAP